MSESKEIAKVESGYMTIIEKIASNPTPEGIAMMEKLMAMQKEWEDRQAEKQFNIDMAALRGELPAVLKNKHNGQTNSDYADLEAIKEVSDVLLPNYGFYDRYEDDFPSDRVIGTTCEIVHKSGHSKRNRVQFTLDDAGIKGTVNKTALHAGASTMTYGQRLSLGRAIGIRISKDDDGNQAVSFITTEQALEIDSLVKEAKADRDKFLEFMGVSDTRNIRANEFKKAVRALKQKAKVA
jgi:hypothetical protein